jgi:hypothetical protein
MLLTATLQLNHRDQARCASGIDGGLTYGGDTL